MRRLVLLRLAPPAVVTGAWRATSRPSGHSPRTVRGKRAGRALSRLAWPLAVAAAALCVAASFPEPAQATPSQPRVTVISDSVLTAVSWNATPSAVLGDGFELRMAVGVCRKLTGVSCPFEGGTVETLVDLVARLGPALGPTVVVEVGYSDDPATFSDSVEQSIDALLAAGVKRILWVNMREWQPQYVGMNATLVAAAECHPEVTVVDWNAYSRYHYSWFQSDGIHLVYGGAMAIATLLHREVLEALAPPLVVTTERLPTAQVGIPYSTRLVASGGLGPYTWRLLSGPLPRGLRLLADGTVVGTPRRSGQLRLSFRVTDGGGHTATRSETLPIRRTALG